MVTKEWGEAGWDPSHPAPPALEPARLLANTLDLYRDRDLLHDPTTAAIALASTGLLDGTPAPTEADLRALRRARAAIRALVSGEPVDASWTGGVRLAIGSAGVDAEVSTHGVPGRLALLALELLVAGRDGSLRRLKACDNPGCRWLFWDVSRPGTGRWCSMQVCGGQHKARAYRARRRQDA